MGSETSKLVTPSHSLSDTACKLVCSAVMSTATSVPLPESLKKSSHAEVNGCAGHSCGATSSSTLVFCFFVEAAFLGCEATRPLVSGVPVMKTRSLW